jgi:tetratricopeptide (TPR) repeat protein
VLQLRLKLAFARFHQGQWTQSRDELAALSADMDAFSPGVAHFDGYLSRLVGTVSLYLGDFSQAERWLRQARTEVDAIAPPPVAARAAVSTNLGALYIETQRYAEAQQQLDAASDGMLRWFPDDSARIMQIRQVQAKLRLEQGNPREAVAILQDLLRQLSSSAHDTDRDGSSLIRYYLGLGLQAQGQLSEASDMLRGALERGELVNGSDYPLTQQIRIAVADCLLLQKKTGEAKAMLTRIEGGGFPGLPVDHPFIGELHRVKGLLRLQEGDRTAAKAEFADALRILAARYGQAHWRAQQVQHELDRLKAGN